MSGVHRLTGAGNLRKYVVEKSMVFKTVIVSIIGFIYGCASAGEKSVDGRGLVEGRKILGYTQFQVWSKESMLGYIPNEEDPTILKDQYLKPVKVREGEGKQVIEISYSASDLAWAKAQLQKVASVNAGLEDVEAVTFRFIDPSEHVMEDYKPTSKEKKDENALKKKYIVASLKVKRIEVILKTKGGAELKTEADFKKQNILLTAGLKHDSVQNSVYTGEDRFVGYKLLSMPKDIK